MKLSELTAWKKKLDAIDELHDERSSLGQLLAAIEDGDDVEVSCAELYSPVTLVRPAARPALREAICQSLQVVEAELQARGVEIDEPTYIPDADEDDAEDVA